MQTQEKMTPLLKQSVELLKHKYNKMPICMENSVVIATRTAGLYYHRDKKIMKKTYPYLGYTAPYRLSTNTSYTESHLSNEHHQNKMVLID